MGQSETATKTRTRKVANKPQVEKVETAEVETNNEVAQPKERAPKKSKFDSVKEALCTQNEISEIQFLNFVMKKFQGKKVTQTKIAEILIERNLFDKDKLIVEMKG